MSVIVLSDSFIFVEGISSIIQKIDINIEIIEVSTDIENYDLNNKVIIIDGHKDVSSKIHQSKDLINKYDNLKIIIFEQKYSVNNINKLLNMDTVSLISNHIKINEIIFAINQVLVGQKYYDPNIIDKYVLKKDNNIIINKWTLTEREEEIVNHICGGKTNKYIADKMYLSESTVKKHIGNILSKLKLENRKELIVYVNNM